jgi:hypothetical protein
MPCEGERREMDNFVEMRHSRASDSNFRRSDWSTLFCVASMPSVIDDALLSVGWG